MSRSRQHPRHGRGRMFGMAGGQVPPVDGGQEDFPSSPPAGTPPEDSAAGNLPVCADGQPHIPNLSGSCVLCGIADLAPAARPSCGAVHDTTRLLCSREAGHLGWHRTDVPADHEAYNVDDCQVIDWVPEDSSAVSAAIDWDRAAAVEPYQVDVTRTMDDTTRMGNSLSAAVRLELLADSMREQVRDDRLATGPGYPEDYPRDPVSGDQLDPVDGLPVVDEDQAADVVDLAHGITSWSTLADLEASLRPMTYAAPGPARPDVDDTWGAKDLDDYEEPPLPVVPMTAEQAASTRGAAARVLNWTSRHDPKSLEYGVRQRLRAPAPLVDREWGHGPILDQGTTPPLSLHDASGCTGHAAVNAANVLELDRWDGYTPTDRDLMDGADAMRLYERAQELDEVPGEAYPGTSILAVMKAGQEAGLWGGYLWAFGTRDVAQAILQVGPVIIGIPWYSGMTETDPDGIVTVDGDDQGGHALCLHAIAMKVAGRAGPWFGALQTWGQEVGDGGVIWIHHRDLARLLAGYGEAAIPVPDTL